jgi:hypothetical protein
LVVNPPEATLDRQHPGTRQLGEVDTKTTASATLLTAAGR